MNIPLIGMAVSAAIIVLLSLLFRIERVSGFRICKRLRIRCDDVVDRSERVGSVFLKHISRDVVRQSIHFSFHTVLTTLLNFLDAMHAKIQVLVRTNKVMARRSRTAPGVTKNKLDEIAEHKISVALSDEEKKEHKERLLNG